MDNLISTLSEIRSQYNCFDEAEEPYYRALSEAIKKLSERVASNPLQDLPTSPLLVRKMPSAQPKSEERIEKSAQNVPNNDLISRKMAIDKLNREIIKRRLLDEIYDGALDEFQTEEILRKLPSAQSEITLESAIDYLHSIGWMQNHDKQMYEDGQNHAQSEPQWIPCSECERKCDKWEHSKISQE